MRWGHLFSSLAFVTATFVAASAGCGNDDCAESSTCAGEVNAPDGAAPNSDSGGSEGSSSSEGGSVTDSASDSAIDSGADSNTPWTPAKITNLVLWLDGDDAIANVNGTVDTWFDKSPFKTDAKTSSAAQTPVLLTGASSINGHKALRFDGATSFFTIADAASLQWHQNFMIEAVFRNAAATKAAVSPIFSKLTPGGSSPEGPYLTYGAVNPPSYPTTMEFGLQNNAFIDSDQAGFPPGTHRVRATWDLASTTLSMQLDKTTPVSGVHAATNVASVGQDVLIGKEFNLITDFLNGDLAEIVAVAGATISQADILQLQDYLDTKYGL